MRTIGQSQLSQVTVGIEQLTLLWPEVNNQVVHDPECGSKKVCISFALSLFVFI